MKNWFLCFAAFLVGALISWFAVRTNEPTEERFRKCEFNVENTELRVADGWDINTVVTRSDGVQYSPVLFSIFDVVCYAKPVIYEDLTLYYLQNGGKVNLDQLERIIIASKTSGYHEILDEIYARLPDR